MINEQNPAYFLKVKEWNPAHDSSFSSLRKTDNGDVPAVAAFDSGNLLAVATALHDRFPDKRIMIVGDDDHKGAGSSVCGARHGGVPEHDGGTTGKGID